MKKYAPQSFRSRLMLGAIVWVSVALSLGYLALSTLLRQEADFIFRGELQEHLLELAGIVGSEGPTGVVLLQPLSDARFLSENSGYYYQAERSDGALLRSPSLGGARLAFKNDPLPEGAERESTIPGPNGDVLFIERSARPPGSPDLLRIGVGIDKSNVDYVASNFDRIIGQALFVVGGGLLLAVLAQLQYGFRFVGRLRKSLAQVRAGEASRLPESVPTELTPLVRDFNALIEANEEIVRRARLEAGNLAHVLKTPLAILMDEAMRLDSTGHRSEGQRVSLQCERMRRAINYQFARVRAAVYPRGRRAATSIGPVIRSDVSALSRLYASRNLSFEIQESALEAVISCEAEDFEEMFANLVDNAAKWAVRLIRISATMDKKSLCLRVEDDGPGMPKEVRDRVFDVGERLDERIEGCGLGLAIVRDLSTLYGGKAWIEDSPLGGAAACRELPLVQR